MLKISFALALMHFVSYASCREYYAEKPEWIKTCKIYQPGFTNCSTESIQNLMAHVCNDEVPEIKELLGSLDPFKVTEVTFVGDNNQAVTIKADLSDLEVTGFSKMIINESRISKKDFSWQTKIRLPKMRIDGQYKMTGRILLIPLNGHGTIFIDINDLDIVARSKVRLYEKDGFTFYNVTEVKVELEIASLTTYLDNIFNGNSKEVEISTNKLFNENWRDFFEALRPLITDTVERILLRVLKVVFNTFPANFFIEDIPKSTELYAKNS